MNRRIIILLAIVILAILVIGFKYKNPESNFSNVLDKNKIMQNNTLNNQKLNLNNEPQTG